jgi:hypothetical protein
LKKHTATFIISAVVFSVVLQALFAYFVIKTTELDRFIYIRKKVEKCARLSAGTADSYMEFRKDPGTAILAVPSCNLNKILIPDSFDFFIMHTDSHTAVFSVYPSALSAREHKSLYMKDMQELAYEYSGGLFGFKCKLNGVLYGRSFYITSEYSLMPSGIEVF